MAPLPKKAAFAITVRHSGSTDEQEGAPEEPAAQSSNHGITPDRNSLYEVDFTFLVPR
ncbi:hypothetical protein RvY_12491 [Ramazzottius varieornatus]|uniref:Uncharacterized protein n=1 Tax=Ramazzottius varieornatus TaxID=947166 RepID=A0A1D1VJQ1_RAMVA|nr:hypothetical protein RvY_12491 [Ramazzottius varieornatus]